MCLSDRVKARRSNKHQSRQRGAAPLLDTLPFCTIPVAFMSEQSTAKKPPRKTRSGSEQRKMQPRIIFRVDEELRSKANRDAAAGFTVGSYMRRLLADECSIRPTRRPLPSESLLRELIAEAGHADGNLAQFLRKVNYGELVPTDRLDDAYTAVRDFWRKALELLASQV